MAQELKKAIQKKKQQKHELSDKPGNPLTRIYGAMEEGALFAGDPGWDDEHYPSHLRAVRASGLRRAREGALARREGRRAAGFEANPSVVVVLDQIGEDVRDQLHLA